MFTEQTTLSLVGGYPAFIALLAKIFSFIVSGALYASRL